MGYNVAMQRLLGEMPARFRKLPISPAGYPVPKFVQWTDGVPDFRVMDGNHMRRCVEYRVCWLCGEPLGRYLAFVIGPMCAINRTSAEPPSHLECARFAAKACPFMVNPERKRDGYTPMPEGAITPAGIPLERNPGAYLIWVTKDYRLIKTNVGIEPGHPGGILFRIGEPEMLEWYARGRTATRAEIMASIDSGLPLLRKIAEEDGPKAIAELNKQVERGLALVPAT